MGESAAKPKQAQIHLYMKQDGGADNAAEQLKQTWEGAKEWLVSAGVAAEDMKLADPIIRPAPDGTHKMMIQRVTLTRALTGEGGPDAELLAMAKLIDRAAARGLSPASQLSMMGVEMRDLFALQEQDSVNVLPFIVFLPDAAADKLQD